MNILKATECFKGVNFLEWKLCVWFVCLFFSQFFKRKKKVSLIFRILSLPFPGKVSVWGKSKQNGC